jgi:hypothetical protein
VNREIVRSDVVECFASLQLTRHCFYCSNPVCNVQIPMGFTGRMQFGRFLAVTLKLTLKRIVHFIWSNSPFTPTHSDPCTRLSLSLSLSFAFRRVLGSSLSFIHLAHPSSSSSDETVHTSSSRKCETCAFDLIVYRSRRTTFDLSSQLRVRASFELSSGQASGSITQASGVCKDGLQLLLWSRGSLTVRLQMQ